MPTLIALRLRITGIQDADIANVFCPSYAETVNLPLRISCEAKAGEQDLEYAFPAGPVAVPASMEDSFVICDKPDEADSDSDWSLM
ncbi:hypothetical protein GTA08_BOTSDO08421 [Botryosphaeria dothidea]|uniref:Uncharacterized protein n=1 Tax=Botryosphaeria dothidea TaxID=55169 RepID=A0A8H4IN95_9PEZI|nr:hypothetical protein GTA08_BOTSDO08421 [Botryosphaeria dothidea]